MKGHIITVYTIGRNQNGIGRCYLGCRSRMLAGGFRDRREIAWESGEMGMSVFRAGI